MRLWYLPKPAEPPTQSPGLECRNAHGECLLVVPHGLQSHYGSLSKIVPGALQDQHGPCHPIGYRLPSTILCLTPALPKGTCHSGLWPQSGAWQITCRREGSV